MSCHLIGSRARARIERPFLGSFKKQVMGTKIGFLLEKEKVRKGRCPDKVSAVTISLHFFLKKLICFKKKITGHVHKIHNQNAKLSEGAQGPSGHTSSASNFEI